MPSVVLSDSLENGADVGFRDQISIPHLDGMGKHLALLEPTVDRIRGPAENAGYFFDSEIRLHRLGTASAALTLSRLPIREATPMRLPTRPDLLTQAVEETASCAT